MSSPISSLRILPAETGAAALRSAESSEPGFRETLRSAMDDIQQLQGAGRDQGRRSARGQRHGRAQRHDRGGKSRSQFSADDAGAQQDRVRLPGDLAHAVLSVLCWKRRMTQSMAEDALNPSNEVLHRLRQFFAG